MTKDLTPRVAAALPSLPDAGTYPGGVFRVEDHLFFDNGKEMRQLDRSIGGSNPLNRIAPGPIKKMFLDDPYFIPFPDAGTSTTLVSRPEGESGVITRVQMSLGGGATDSALPFDCRLLFYADQSPIPDIDVDLGTLFASHAEAHTGAAQHQQTTHVGMSVEGTGTQHDGGGDNSDVSYELALYMPYSNGCRFEMLTPSGVTVPDNNALFFVADYLTNITSPLRLRSRCQTRLQAAARSAYAAADDVPLFDMPNNNGVLVWQSFYVFGATLYGFGERPWFFFRDEEEDPSYVVTGMEEFWGTGFFWATLQRFSDFKTMLTANNNDAFSLIAGIDWLAGIGGITFENALRAISTNKSSPYVADSDHKMSYVFLFYVDTSVTFEATPPQDITSTPGDGSVELNWKLPKSQGSGFITGYRVTLSPDGATVDVDAPDTATTISGLTNGTEYTPSFVTLATDGDSDSVDGDPFTPEVPVEHTFHASFDTPNPTDLGTADTGQAITYAVISAGAINVLIDEDGAEINTGLSNDGNAFAISDVGTTAQDVSVVMNVLGATPVFAGLILRYVDTDNFIILQYDAFIAGATRYALYTKEAGDFSSALGFTTDITPADGDVVEAQVDEGSLDVTITVNGTSFGPFAATGASTTSTKIALTAGSADPGGGRVESTARFRDWDMV